jgi:hypothetical protein
MAGFERRLRLAWSTAVPQVPRHLESYRDRWLDCLDGELIGTTHPELQRAVRRAELMVVSDYHPLERSRTGLAELIAEIPSTESVALVLELLPLGTTLTAREALRGCGPLLVTGQSLCEAYKPALEVLAQRRGAVIGAWVDGSVSRRDEVAAQVWQRINRQGRRRRCVMHFGDWHLAPEHLPARLAASGVMPLVIHQSPEPVWERLGANPHDRTFQTTAGQWVWLHTPPLSLWANLHQDLADSDDELLAEAAEHLCESAAGLLASTFGLDAPSCRLSILPASCWTEFHAKLPNHRAAAFHPHQPPKLAVFHPGLPLAWSPRKLDLSDLIQGAAHSLICDSPLAMEVSFRGAIRRSSFRFLCAHLVNPFLRPAAPNDLFEALWANPANNKRLQGFHNGEWTRNQGRLLEACSRRQPDEFVGEFMPADMEVLLERYWGQLAGSQMAKSQGLDAVAVKEFLQLGNGVFDWGALTDTIRVA